MRRCFGGPYRAGVSATRVGSARGGAGACAGLACPLPFPFPFGFAGACPLPFVFAGGATAPFAAPVCSLLTVHCSLISSGGSGGGGGISANSSGGRFSICATSSASGIAYWVAGVCRLKGIASSGLSSSTYSSAESHNTWSLPSRNSTLPRTSVNVSTVHRSRVRSNTLGKTVISVVPVGSSSATNAIGSPFFVVMTRAAVTTPASVTLCFASDSSSWLTRCVTLRRALLARRINGLSEKYAPVNSFSAASLSRFGISGSSGNVPNVSALKPGAAATAPNIES